MVGLKYTICLSFSLILNLFFFFNIFFRDHIELTWSIKSAEEAEDAASVSCSGHGRAYLDGLLSQGRPVCECNSCYGGPSCSDFLPGCPVNADGGDPLFLEPFWMQRATSSAVMVAGWHRMSYVMPDQSFISAQLESHIRELHAVVGNAVATGKFILFGVGSTQLLHAALYALSNDDNSLKPVSVVASVPYYTMYKNHSEIFKSRDFEWQGDASLWKNTSNNSSKNFIEFVTSPNNPDAQIRQPVLEGSSVKVVYDHAYYWPHYSAIQAPANGDLMIFTISKVTGHAGSRFGWALIKDEDVYKKMTVYLGLNTMGVPRETQLRALELVKVILEDEGKAIFEFGFKTIKDRWERLNKVVAASKRFSLQRLSPQYCSYFKKIRGPSPAYAWMKCEMENDRDCNAVLKTAGIISRQGDVFGDESRYVRLTLLRSNDDFDLLLQRLDDLVSNELLNII